MKTEISTNDNPLHMMAEVLVGHKRRNFSGDILYNIYDEHH